MKKSNLLHFRTNRREQRSKGKQKGKVCAFPAKTHLTGDSGRVIFQYKGKSFLISNIPLSELESVCVYVEKLNAKSGAS